MKRIDYAQLDAFGVLAREQSFTKAAIRLGVSTSALSKTIRQLEARVGVRLVNRTTRSVALTEAGRVLAERTTPALDDIGQAVDDAASIGRDPVGSVRINLPLLAGELVFIPALARFAEAYPRVRLELVVEDGFTDVIAKGCDAGVRLGPAVHQDMVGVPVSKPLRTAIVASPSYLRKRPAPRHPTELGAHVCLSYRWSASGALFRWVLGRGEKTFDLVEEGRFVMNDTNLIVQAALAGGGLAMILKDRVEQELKDGTLVSLLEDWCPLWPPYFLYYPTGRQRSPALQAVAKFYKAADRRDD